MCWLQDCRDKLAKLDVFAAFPTILAIFSIPTVNAFHL
jgi:hypothetical protein